MAFATQDLPPSSGSPRLGPIAARPHDSCIHFMAHPQNEMNPDKAIAAYNLRSVDWKVRRNAFHACQTVRKMGSVRRARSRGGPGNALGRPGEDFGDFLVCLAETAPGGRSSRPH